MNENLQKILEGTFNNVKPNLVEQIAQAVVLECARVCEELRFTPEGPTPEVKHQRILCAAAIKKHFGVY